MTAAKVTLFYYETCRHHKKMVFDFYVPLRFQKEQAS